MTDGWSAVIGAAVGAFGTSGITYFTTLRNERQREKDRAAETQRASRQLDAETERLRMSHQAEQDRWERERSAQLSDTAETRKHEAREAAYREVVAAALAWLDVKKTAEYVEEGGRERKRFLAAYAEVLFVGGQEVTRSADVALDALEEMHAVLSRTGRPDSRQVADALSASDRSVAALVAAIRAELATDTNA